MAFEDAVSGTGRIGQVDSDGVVGCQKSRRNKWQRRRQWRG
ncbi:hypothetical protein A2U01_0065674, partial [Trifolium medium]|nr:hypothetical protein [Trifolium medium]